MSPSRKLSNRRIYPAIDVTASGGGTYKLNNKDVSNMSENELADIRNNEIGFVFQTFNLLPKDVMLHQPYLVLVRYHTPCLKLNQNSLLLYLQL